MSFPSQSRLSMVLAALAGGAGILLAAVMAVGSLTGGSAGSVLFSFVILLLGFLAAGVVLVRRPMLQRSRYTLAAMLVLFLGLCLRLSLFDYQSPDYVSFLSVWTETMRHMTVREALTTPIGDYNMPYLYLILLISRLPFYDVYCIKLFSVLADIASALAVGYLARQLCRDDRIVLLVFCAGLLCPTTWLNSAYWGQCDSIYGALALWGLYAGLRGRSKTSYLLFALSFSFKLQAIFLLPILVFLLTSERIRLRDVWVFPASFLGASLPALLAGRSLSNTFSVYLSQAQAYPYLSLNAPSFWSLINNSFFDNLSGGPVLLALTLALVLMVTLLLRGGRLEPKQLLSLGLIFSLMIPWTLPRMHERYFYLAELLSLSYTAAYPRRAPVALGLMAGGYLCYSLYLFGGMPILSLQLVAAIYGLIILYLCSRLLRELPTNGGSPANLNGGSNDEST